VIVEEKASVRENKKAPASGQENTSDIEKEVIKKPCLCINNNDICDIGVDMVVGDMKNANYVHKKRHHINYESERDYNLQ
jgi:hypothetical protein